MVSEQTSIEDNMTTTEILNYFAGNTVYSFSGTAQELQQLQITTNNSYNYIKVDNIIYFVAEHEVTDLRATKLTVE